MRPMTLVTAGLALLLAAVDSPAAPIIREQTGGGWDAHWTAPGVFHARAHTWRFRPQHKHPRLGLEGLLGQYAHCTYGLPHSSGQPERLDDAYPIPPELQGGAPGAGVDQAYEGAGSPDADDPENEGGGTQSAIGSTRDDRPSESPIPAVPEPGSLALLGAGALGLLAARALLKDR